MTNRITIHADGACSGNPGPGGWAARIRIDQETGSQTYLLTGGDPATTNNIMELEAAESALRHLRDVFHAQAAGAEIILRLDSEYVLKGLGEWIPGWKKRDWRKADGKQVANIDLWQRLDRLQTAVKALGTLKLVHVRGHSGDPDNDAVDRAAVLARDKSRTATTRWTGNMLQFTAETADKETVDPAQGWITEGEEKGYRPFNDAYRQRKSSYVTSLQKRVTEGEDTLFFVNVSLWKAPEQMGLPIAAEASLQFHTGDNLTGKAVNVSFSVDTLDEAEEMAREIWSRMGYGRYESGPETAPSP